MITFALTVLVILAFLLAVAVGLLLGYRAGLRRTQGRRALDQKLAGR